MLGAARSENVDSANSQFFIMLAPNATLNDKYTVYGRVISGMDAVDRIAPGEPPESPTKIVHMSLGG
ncbi:peptidylprolyl isomerase [Sphingomonas daechungensis]